MNLETVFLPPPRAKEQPEVEEPKPLPEEPPKICGGTDVDVTLH